MKLLLGLNSFFLIFLPAFRNFPFRFIELRFRLVQLSFGFGQLRIRIGFFLIKLIFGLFELPVDGFFQYLIALVTYELEVL